MGSVLQGTIWPDGWGALPTSAGTDGIFQAQPSMDYQLVSTDAGSPQPPGPRQPLSSKFLINSGPLLLSLHFVEMADN